jgi:hypothetical protein
MNKRRQRIHKIGEDLFVACASSRSLLIYREGMLPLRVKLSEIEPLLQVLRAVVDDLALDTVSPDTGILRPDD